MVRTLLPVLLALLAPAVLAGGDDEIVREFKRYFRKYKDTPTRVEAILALEGTESASVVEVLVPVLRDREVQVAEAAVQVLAGFETRPPVDRILLEVEANSNERIRLGLLHALELGRYPGTGEALAPLLLDSSWEVRRRTIRALSGQATAAVLIAPLCDDGEPAVRCAALDALAGLGSELVLEPARADLEHESWQVRASAVQALGAVRARASIEPLIDRMAREEGRLVHDIGKALSALTGRNFRDRVDGWQNFWRLYQDRFVMPTDDELRLLRERQRESEAAYEPPAGTVSYHGVETPSRSILFVIDVSGSMEQEVVQRERFTDGSYPSFQRIDIVKTELIRTIERLESYVEFNILSFATEVDEWKKRLVSANVLNKSSATSWSGRLEALGGSSKETLASVGLVGSANLESGKTNSHGALMQALGVTDGASTEDYEVSVDTIFFLSDGRPSHGEYVDTDDILREVREANQLRKIVIHTIAIGEFEKEFMRRLAEENGGVFVDLGR